MTFPERFKQALENAKSIRAFSEEIANAERWGKVPGSSYSMIHRYLRGKDTPPVEFIEKAAQILGVRAAWLRSGEGEPTEIEELAKRGQDQTQIAGDPVVDFVTDRVDARMKEIFPLYDSMPMYVRSMAWHTIVAVSSVIPQPEEAETGEKGRDALLMRAGEIVARSMAALSDLLPDLKLNSEQLGHYGTAVCQALMFAVTPSVKWQPARHDGVDYSIL